MKIFTRNFVLGIRGPSSSVLIERADGALVIGTVFFLEVGGADVVTPSQAAQWCEKHKKKVASRLEKLEDDGFVPGYSATPQVEAVMIEKAKEEAGW